MEKRKPAHDLQAFKLAFRRHRSITLTAVRSARDLGFAVADLIPIIERLMPEHFYKSMTSVANHRQWQDVYHLPHEGRLLYIKFTDDVLTEFILLSFKDK